MRLLIFGATGGTGQHLVRQALDQGHDVSAFVRTPSKLTLRSDRLRAIQGDIRQPETIRSAIPRHDAVLSALGTFEMHETTLLSSAAKVIVGAMAEAGVRNLIWQSSLGVGDTRGQLGPLSTYIFVPLVLRHVFADKERQEAIIRATSLDWTIVQPARLTNGPRTGRYRIGPGAAAGRLAARISRADAADFILREAADRTHVREVVPLCY